MKKNLLTAVAGMVAALFVGTTIAEAASVDFGGQIRPRFEINEQSDFNDSTSADFFISSRVRLHAKADILPDTSAFIQLQSTRVWGNNIGGAGAEQGAGNASFTANDADASVGIHQAYFTHKNLFGLPADLKLGRQEVVLDGHRLFGNTGWTEGAQTHDAVRLTHSAGNHTLAAVYIRGNDGGQGSLADPDDVDVYLLWANLQGILGGGLSLYFVAVDDEAGLTGTNGPSAGPSDNNSYTIGARQAGQLFGIDYRGEFYYQFGGAESIAASIGAYGANGVVTGPGSDIDREAYMFGVRVGKKFTNVMWKPSVTLWYDYLSGTSEDDIRDGDFSTFNTLFDTGHKFYGFMDLFLNNNGAATNFLGLVDYAIKTSIQPRSNWVFKADWHYFTTAEGPNAAPNLTGSAATRFDSSALGHELDLTLVHKYNANTTISAGFSNFWKESLFSLVNTAGPDNASWAYLQFDVKF